FRRARCKLESSISVIDQTEVIKAILQHVGLWEVQKRPPPAELYAADYSQKVTTCCYQSNQFSLLKQFTASLSSRL
ncbi:MAG: hypothetical protein NTV89_11600, partial [Proteobacteria bacterium]|nr:hypothetical protein [Pseudomonadota bacterium]